jgi:hypothetical protein
MSMPIVNYVCSLGPRCHTSGLLKRNQLKKASYPFDWIFSDTEMILHCLNDNFSTFLDKKYFTIHDENSKCQQHSFYSRNNEDTLFNHHNPLKKQDYNYFIRCIQRFKDLLIKPELKMFVLFYLNCKYIDVNFKNNILDFNTKLSSYTKNYGILCIVHYTSQDENKIRKHKVTIYDNVHFLEITTRSKSNGLEFDDPDDNLFLDHILINIYQFQLNEIPNVKQEHHEVD